MKSVKLVIAGLVSTGALTGCATQSTQSEVPPTSGRTATYQIVTGWVTISADNDMATDVMVRTVKIENQCFVQSASVYDWTYNLMLLPSCPA